MAERQIWKIDKFGGGLNDSTDPKDLKNNEFAELVDVQVSEIGEIKALGHCTKSLDILGVRVQDIIFGTGFYSFFSDYTVNPNPDTSITVGVQMRQVATSGSYSSEVFRIGSMYWAFPQRTSGTGSGANYDTLDADRPMRGKLTVQIGFWTDRQEDGTFEFVPIHGDGNAGNTNPLVVLDDASNWETLGGSAVGGGDSVNLLNTGSYYKYTSPGEYGVPTSGGTPDNPDVLYHPGVYLDIFPHIDMWPNGENRIAGRYWNRKSEAILGSNPLFSNEYLSNNQPNSPFAKHDNADGDVTLHWWHGTVKDYDTGSIWEGWGSEDPSDGENHPHDYGPWVHDNRWIFGNPHPSNPRSVYAIGWSNWENAVSDVEQNSGTYPVQYEHNYLEFSAPFDTYIPYDYSFATGHFPYPNPEGVLSMVSGAGEEGVASRTYFEQMWGWGSWNSFGHHLIKAINTYAGSDKYDKFTAEWVNYEYLKDSTTENHENPARNENKEYTNIMGDWIRLTSQADGSQLNGASLCCKLESESVKDDDGNNLTQRPATWTNLYEATTLNLGQDRGRLESAMTLVNNNDGQPGNFNQQLVFKVTFRTAKWIRAGEMLKIVNPQDTSEFEFVCVRAVVRDSYITGLAYNTNSIGQTFSTFMCSIIVIRACYGKFTGEANRTNCSLKEHLGGGAGNTAHHIYKQEIMPLAVDEHYNNWHSGYLAIEYHGAQVNQTGDLVAPSVLSESHYSAYRDWGEGFYCENAGLSGGDAGDIYQETDILIGGAWGAGDVISLELYNNAYNNVPFVFAISDNSDGTEEGAIGLGNLIIQALDSAIGIEANGVVDVIESIPDSGVFDILRIPLKSNVAGVSGSFSIHTFVMPTGYVSSTENVFQGVSEEYTTIMYETNESVNDADNPSPSFEDSLNNSTEINAPGSFYRTKMHLHSKLTGGWLSGLNLPGGVDPIPYGEKLDWWYKGNPNKSRNKPIYWNEGSRMRICDANFALDNSNMYMDFVDIRTWFQNLNSGNVGAFSSGYTSSDSSDDTDFYDTIVEANNSGIAHWGQQIINNDRSWRYSVNSNYNSAYRGLSKEAQADTTTYGMANSDLAEEDIRAGDVGCRKGSKCIFELDNTGGTDWTGVCKFYASVIFSDDGESLPVHNFRQLNDQVPLELDFTPDEGDDMEKSLNFYFGMKPFLDGTESPSAKKGFCFDDINVKGLHIYYTTSDENHDTFWSLGRILWTEGFVPENVINTSDIVEETEVVRFTRNVTSVSEDAIPTGVLIFNKNINKAYYKFKSMPKLQTFDTVNGFSPYNKTLNCRYKSHTIAGRRSFVGNIAVKEHAGSDILSYYNDRMIVSPVNQLDSFPYPNNVLDLDISDGDEIIDLASTGDKVFQFKKNIMYIINISSGLAYEFFVESRHKFKGLATKEHLVETPDGMFWVNEFGAYLYDGEDVKDLHITGDENNKKQRLDIARWRNFVNDTSLVCYNPQSKECFVVKSHTQVEISDGDCYIYNIITDSWTYGKGKFYVGGTSTTASHLTNIINTGINRDIAYMYDKPYGTGPTDDGSPIT